MHNIAIATMVRSNSPVARVGPDQTVDENTTVILIGVASDPDSTDILRYSWTQEDGPAVTLRGDNTTNPTFVSPEITSNTILRFSFEAIDDKGVTSSPAIITITVKPINSNPIANAGTDQTVNSGHIVSLDGSVSKDPDGDSLTYLWKQTDGPSVKLNGADKSIATLATPTDITTDTDLIFELTVTDANGATDTEDSRVVVKYIPPPNQSPIANAGTDQTVNAGADINLDATASSDPEGNPLTYSWMQTGGPAVTINGD